MPPQNMPPTTNPIPRSCRPQTLETTEHTDLGPEMARGRGRAADGYIYLLVGDLGLVGEDEVDGELGGDGGRRGRARLHEGEGRRRGLDVGGDLLPRLDERGVLGGLRGHLRRGERPAGGRRRGGAGDETAGGVAQHFFFPARSLSLSLVFPLSLSPLASLPLADFDECGRAVWSSAGDSGDLERRVGDLRMRLGWAAMGWT